MLSVDSKAIDRYRMVDPFSPEGKSQRNRRSLPLKIIGIVAVIAIAVLLGFFAWEELRGPSIEAYASEPIVISGLAEDDLVLTPAELAEMDCISESFTGQGKAIAGEDNLKEIEAFGPFLAELAAENGVSISDFNRAVAYCKDGYTVVLTPEMLSNDIIMSIAQGNEPLEERHQPMRLVIPGEESGKWAYGVTELVFER